MRIKFLKLSKFLRLSITMWRTNKTTNTMKKILNCSGRQVVYTKIVIFATFFHFMPLVRERVVCCSLQAQLYSDNELSSEKWNS